MEELNNTNLDKQLTDEIDKNIRDFYNGSISYEEFHYLQSKAISKLKEIRHETDIRQL